MGGIDIGRYIGATGRSHRTFRRIKAHGCNLVHHHFVFKVAIDRVITAVLHQVHLIKIVSFGLRIILRILVMAINDYKGGRKITLRDRTLVEIGGSAIGIGHSFSSTLLLKIGFGGHVGVKRRTGRQIGSISPFLKISKGQLLVILDKTGCRIVRNNGPPGRNIHHRKADGGKIGVCCRTHFYLGPVTD